MVEISTSGDEASRYGAPEGAADDGRIEVIEVLPGVIAHHGGDGSAFAVIGVVHQAAGGGLKAEHAKVVAGDELGHGGARLFLTAVASRGERAVLVARLHGCQLGEVGVGASEFVECVRGEETVVAVIMHSLADAACPPVADADEGFGIGDGKVAKQDGVDEVKMAAFAPIPRARVRTTVRVKPGVLRS